MAYWKTRILIRGLAYVPINVLIAIYIKGKFGTKTEKAKNNGAKEEPVKIIEIQDAVVKEGKAEAIKKLSNKLDSIE